MPDPFVTAAGPAPARGLESRWRQVALLSAAAALGDDPRAPTGLAAALLALDHPAAASTALERADPTDPWTRWWRVLAAGQEAGAKGLRAALDAARAVPCEGPDAREVSRRLEDLDDELAAMAGDDADGRARFAVLGHRARPDRRMLIGGRSSAAFLVDPGWDGMRLVRLAPSDGPALGNRAHLTLPEVIGAVRRGESGPGWTVPSDDPPPIEPAEMLSALREDPAARDRRLVNLAREVAEERERLVAERAALAEERAILATERARRPRPRPSAASAAPADPVAVPRTSTEAAALLGVADGAPAAEVERAWREQVTRCHPDRVAELHPSIRHRAESLTVALNAARDVLLGRAAPRRAQRARG